MNSDMSTEHTATSTQTEKGVFFWVFLGPLSMLMSLSLLLLTAPEDYVLLPLVLLTGVGLTWMFSLYGLLASLALLGAYSLYQFSISEAESSLWFIGSMFSIAFSYVITYLTLEEAKEVVAGWRRGALGGTTTALEAESKVTELEHKLTLEKTLVKNALAELEMKEEHLKGELQSLEKVQELSRLELLSTISKHDAATEELYDLRNKTRKLEEELENKQETLEANKKVIDKLQSETSRSKDLNALIDTLTREKDLLESTLSRIQAELEEKENLTARYEKNIADWNKEKEIHLNALSKLQEELSIKEASYQSVDQDLTILMTKSNNLEQLVSLMHDKFSKQESELQVKTEELDHLKTAFQNLETEAKKASQSTEDVNFEAPPATEADYRRLFGMHRQLKDQFAEKSKQLDESRKEAFMISEKVNLLQIELEGMHLEDSPELKKLSKEMNDLVLRNQTLEKEVINLESLVSSLLK